MPVTITKTDGYQVRTNRIHAKHTTLAKAKRQRRLLNAVEHGWVSGKSKKKKSFTDEQVRSKVKSAIKC